LRIRFWPFFLIWVVSLFSISCCLRQGELKDRFNLTEEDIERIPYENGDILNFIHSEGFQFECTIRTENFFSSTQEACEDYFENEVFSAFFESDIPSLNIELQLSKFIGGDSTFFGISSDFTSFILEQQSPQIIIINGVEYNDVETYFSSNETYFIENILYNSTIGILKINYKDNSYVEILP